MTVILCDLLMALCMLLIGFLFYISKGKAANFLSGYNRRSKKARDKYDEIEAQSDDKMKSLDIKKVFSEAKANFCSDFGDFVSYGKIYSVESSQLGKTYAVVQMSVAYENVSATYTLSFDEDMKLAGMYIK